MPPLSRPFQILVVVFVLFAGAYGAWYLLLREPSSSTSTSTSEATPTTARIIHTPNRPQASTTTTPESGKVYHGSAPGVEGLTRDVARAHGAVKAAQSSGEHELEKAGAAPTARAGAAPTSSPAKPAEHVKAPPVTRPATHSASRPARHGATKPAASAARPSTSSGAAGESATDKVPARQAQVEAALKQGKVAVILFWNPNGAEDVADRAELRALEHAHRGVAAFEASAGQVTDFGTITRGVQVYGTPTLLVVNPHGQVVAVTGLTDVFAIEQAIDEARHA